MKTNVKFAKVRPDAKIPSKRVEDMGFDIYACFDEDYIAISPHETKLIPTGIASSCDPEYGFILRERGSTGSKGIALRCGVIDSGYRSEWFIGLTNTTDKDIFISKISPEELYDREFPEGFQEFEHIESSYGCSIAEYEVPIDRYDEFVLVYPYTKAIAQALVIPVPEVEVEELSYEVLQAIPSERGLGALGSSGK